MTSPARNMWKLAASLLDQAKRARLEGEAGSALILLDQAMLAVERLASLPDLSEETRSVIKLRLTENFPEFARDRVAVRNNIERLWQGSDPTDLGSELELMLSRLAVLVHTLQDDLCLSGELSSPEKSPKRAWAIAAAVGAVIAIGVTYHIRGGGDNGGLTGYYFSDSEFQSLRATRVDKVVYFDWGFGSPLPALGRDHFSVRWTGRLIAPEAGRYEIITESDDGVRVKIDDRVVVEDWASRPWKRNQSEVTMLEGEHQIRIEYFEDFADAGVRLFWKRPGALEPEIIPSRYLRPQ